MTDQYALWLQKQGVPIFKQGGALWRLYQGALITANPAPCYITLNKYDVTILLKKSKAWFLRYSSDPCEKETEWWYVICDNYDWLKLKSKIRNMIKHGNHNCNVEKIRAAWLAEHGYDCYRLAHQRYRNALPASEDNFHKSISSTIDGPFEYWGVFKDGNLAGYCQCIIEGQNVVTSAIKYDPSYLKYYSSYALTNKLLYHYVCERHMTISNGNRPIAHDTMMQDFLLKFGYRRLYCCLNVFYHPLLKLAVKTMFPYRKIFNFPKLTLLNKMAPLLLQEDFRRKCHVHKSQNLQML